MFKRRVLGQAFSMFATLQTRPHALTFKAPQAQDLD
jgi:hypothetical protein